MKYAQSVGLPHLVMFVISFQRMHLIHLPLNILWSILL